MDKNIGDEKKEKRPAFVPPTLDELKSYISEKGYIVNAEKFYNHYKMVGWMVGKNKMKDWKAAVAKWNAAEKEKSEQQPAGNHSLKDNSIHKFDNDKCFINHGTANK